MILVPTGRYRLRRLLRKRKPPARPALMPQPHRGRPYGKIPGSWVGDLADLANTILLCDECRLKFDHKKNRYHLARRYRVGAKCDGCREFRCGDMQAYHHESLLGTHAGSVYDPRRE